MNTGAYSLFGPGTPQGAEGLVPGPAYRDARSEELDTLVSHLRYALSGVFHFQKS